MKDIILLLHLQVLWLTFSMSDTLNSCADIRRNTCSDCIQHPGCAWCADDLYTEQRCDAAENHVKNKCSVNKTVNPTGKSEYPDYHQLDLTDQIYPRKLNLTVRVGEPFSFKVDVQPARNYPVDLYFVMDFSESMADDLENLKLLASNISRKLHELTKNYRLAFGSYVDKVTQPYVMLKNIGKAYCKKDRETLQEKCYDPPYDFKHHLHFTNDASEFQANMNAAVPSRNRDDHEGLLDALMQIAACETELKWKPKETSRRMVLIATDDVFHIAGEGKLGGVIEPNDEQCHLANEDGILQYSKEVSLKQDYPSLNQIFQVLKKNGIQPMFAIGKADKLPIYQNLAETWEELSATASFLGPRSENITSLIEESYKKIVSTVRFTSVLPKGIKLKLTPDCGNATKVFDTCQNVIPGNSVSFDVSVTADSCDIGNNSSLKLVAPGIGEVEINLNIICHCDCQSVQEFNSSRCSGNGTFVCGTCQCSPRRTGEICQCSVAEGRRSSETENCKLTNSSNLVCEANGECVCGECKCKSIGNTKSKFYGKYCQCSDFNCEQFENKLCGGPTHGECKCGKCYCEDGYTGSNCADEDCSFKNEQCINNNGLNCSGNGFCECGVCKCHPFYEGQYCENCPSCDGKCIDYNACVLCGVFDQELSNKTGCDTCPEIVKIGSVSEFDELNYPATCEYTDNDGCTYRFTYGTNGSGENVTIYALTIKDCPEGPNVLLIVLVVIGTILGIGILLLILWKVFTAMVDRREYEKFEKEKAQSKWHRERNPLFKPATSTVLNPTYVGSRKS